MAKNFDDGSYSCTPGIDLIAKVLAGKCKMQYTKATVGKGNLDVGENPKDQTEVKDYVMDAQIAAITTPVNGECQVTIQLNSANVETGFYATGILLYAADEDGHDIPYTYLVLENEPEWIRPKTSDIGKLATFDLIVAVGDVDSVSAVIDTDSVMTRQAAEQLLEDRLGSLPSYNPEATYKVGDVVNHDGKAYRCKKEITAGKPWDAADWEVADLYVEAKILMEDAWHSEVVEQRLYVGVDLEEKFADEISQEEGTDEEKRWKWMKKRIDAHNWKGLRPGDYLKLNVKAMKDTGTGEDGANAGTEQVEEHEMQIAGIDTYYNCGGAEHHSGDLGDFSTNDAVPIPHHIDFISRDLLNTPVKWNTTATNCGTTENGNKTGSDAATENVYGDGTDAPYIVSNVRKYLHEKILPTINKTVSDLFTDKVALLEIRGKTSEALTDSTWYHWYKMGKLWIPTEYEVYGSVMFGTKGWGSGQAVQYPIFADSNLNRIKNIGPGTTTRGSWWLACAVGGSSTDACLVSYTGHADAAVATYSAIRVPVCFRIAAAS